MNRVVALDVGDVRIGIASSDLLKMIASPFAVYVRKNTEEDFLYFKNLLIEREADTLVIGLPLSLDGTESLQTQKVRAFAAELAKYTDIPMVFVDERMTTCAAEDVLLEGNVSRKGRKKVVDKIAASIILQDYLNTIRPY